MEKGALKRFLRWLPIIIVLGAMIVVYVTGLYHYFSFEVLKEKHELLLIFEREHPFLSPLIFIALFIVVVAVSLPVADILAVLGGFLFTFPWSMIYVLIGATTGACILYLAASFAIQDFLLQKAAPFFKKMKNNFQKDAWCYLLFLRFIPLFPFWLVNIVPAFFKIRFFTYFWTTFIGIIPLTYLHVEIGGGLNTLLEKHEHFSIHALFNPQMRIALVLLGFFALAPLAIKKWAKKWK